MTATCVRRASIALLLFGFATAALSQTAIPGFGPFSYDGAGNITAVGNDSYIYDASNRLKKATIGTTTEEYTYDRYGNIETVTLNGTDTKTFGVRASSNRMDQSGPGIDLSATYDARGNVTQTSAFATFTYDGTDTVRESAFDGASHLYLYTAGGERLGTITRINGNTARSDWTVRDPSGKVLRRFAESQSGTWSWEEDYVYRDGQLLAAEVPRSEKTLHFHLDHLGTPRLITGNGGVQIALHTYTPFGTELTSPAQDPEALKFTGHERDAAALDYMHARYYNAVMRRFLSPDPVLGESPNPQSWNTYSYALNNPSKFTDPTGQEETAYSCDENGDNCYYETTQPALEYTALDTAAEFLDGVGFSIFSMSGAGDVMAGIANDSPLQVATGYGKQLMWAGPSATANALKPATGAAGSLIVNLPSEITRILSPTGTWTGSSALRIILTKVGTWPW